MKRWFTIYSGIGLLLGAVLGYYQPEIQGLRQVEQQTRWFMAFQMGMAFAILFILIDSYVRWRKEIIKRLAGEPRKKG